MSIEIRRVEGRRGLKAFVRFPYRIYAGDPNWVPPLDIDDLHTLSADKNPAFEFSEAEYWIAYRDGESVGRIAGIINRHANEKWGKDRARFGFIDFIEDFEVASALIKRVEDWARSKGMTSIQGPMGFTDLDREGMLIEGFDERGTMATYYNRPYYPAYLERLGYRKDIDWIEFRVDTPDEIPEKVLRVQELVGRRTGIRLYEWRSKRELVSKFAEQLFDLLDEAYAHLYGTTSLTRRQVRFYIDTYLGFVDPRFTKVLVDAEDRLIGFCITMPSLSRALQKAAGRLFPLGWFHLLRALKKNDEVDMYLVAVKKEYQARGAIAFMMTALNKTAHESGIKHAETNPELETNVEVHGIWKDFRKRQHKRRRVFVKDL